MGAPKNNQFWKARSKHGRDKVFSSPDVLWEASCEYFQWCDDNKWDGEKVRPYTIEGLCIFLGINSRTFRNYQSKDEYKDFLPILSTIEDIIRTQKFEGAAVGAFNSNIIARDLGLKDETSIEHKGGISFADGLKKIGETVKANPELEKKLEDELKD